jgi:hypothetical protein
MLMRIGLDEYKRHAAAHPWIGQQGGINRHIEHPVCPRCERIALRDAGWEKERRAACPACGWRGRSSTTLNEYIQQQMYRS